MSDATRCGNCGADEDEPHEDGCVPCPGAVGPCRERIWEDQLGCGPTHAAYNYAELVADRDGGRI